MLNLTKPITNASNTNSAINLTNANTTDIGPLRDCAILRLCVIKRGFFLSGFFPVFLPQKPNVFLCKVYGVFFSSLFDKKTHKNHFFFIN